MILNIFLIFVSANYVEITKENEEKYLVDVEKPILVKFYSPSCINCQEIEAPFSEASVNFEDIVMFGGLNCVDFPSIAEKYNVTATPTLLLFKKDNKEIISYDGDRDADSITDFVEKEINIESKRPPPIVKELNPITYYKFLRKKNCSFILFHDPPEGSQKNPLKNIFSSLARTFEAEENISFGVVDCVKFTKLCTRNAKSSLQLFVSKNNLEIVYKDEPKEEKLIHFVNEKCGTSRASDGMLNDDCGTIQEANKIAADFAKADEKKRMSMIEEMKKINGAEFYVTVMKRIMETGMEKLEKDVEKMRDFMDQKKGSMKTIDGIKKRFNVMSVFIPFEFGPDDINMSDL